MNTVPKAQDSKAKSLSEAFVNSFGAYPIGYAIGIIILPLSMGWLQDDVYTANLFITLVYATFSFVRIFFVCVRTIFVGNNVGANVVVCWRGIICIRNEHLPHYSCHSARNYRS